MNKKIKITYIVKNLGINGISSVLMNYCSLLDKKKFEITVFAGPPTEITLVEQLKQLNVNVVITPPKRGKNPFKYFYFLWKNMNKKNLDILHVHGNSATISIELFIAMIRGIKVRIAHSHNTTCDKKISHFLLQPLLNKLCNLPLACGKEAGQWMFGKNKKFIVIPNGNDFIKYQFNYNIRKEIRKKYNLEDKIIIGHVGNFNYQKNHEYIIEIMRKLIFNSNNNYLFVLIGYGSEFIKIKEKVRQYNLEKNILFLGKVSSNDVARWLNAFDVMIFPSRFEGFPNVLIEWQINGLPCIISNKISKDVKITNLVKFLPIGDDSIDCWCDNIKKIDCLEDRTNLKEKIKSNLKKYNLDIEENVQMLSKMYIKFYNKEMEKGDL